MAADESEERKETPKCEVTHGSWGWSEGRVKKFLGLCLVRGGG